MQVPSAVLEEVQRLTADVLQLEPEEVRPEAQFFGDLGGESLDLLELKFRLEKQFIVRVPFHDLTANDFELDERGCLTPSSFALLKTKFPFLKLEEYESRPLNRRTDILTIEAIAGFVQMALNSRAASPLETASAVESNGNQVRRSPHCAGERPV
jgi:acyl carrier protein